MWAEEGHDRHDLTRGHPIKLIFKRFRIGKKKYPSSQHIIILWHLLKDDVIVSNWYGFKSGCMEDMFHHGLSVLLLYYILAGAAWFQILGAREK